MDWISFAFGFATSFALFGLGVFVAAVIGAIRNAGKKK